MIYVLGDIIRDVDYHYTSIRKSPEGDFPVVIKDKETCRAGGAGAVAGMLAQLRNPEFILLYPKKTTCIKHRHFIDGNQIFRHDVDNTELLPASYADELLKSITPNSIVLVADYGKGVITDYLWENLLNIEGLKIYVDPSKDKELSFYAGASAIIPNRYEARILEYATEAASIQEARSRYWENLKDIFPDVCIKLDKHGMLCNMHWIAAENKKIVDVCGAGDMVLAAIGHGIQKGLNFTQACKFASGMAGLVCQVQGAYLDSGLYESQIQRIWDTAGSYTTSSKES